MDTSEKECDMPVAVITGASRGLGRVLADEFVRRGFHIVIDARDGESLAVAAAELSRVDQRGNVVAIAGDVSDPAHRQRLIAAAQELGGVDVLVNNASVLGPSPQPELSAYPLDILRHVYEVNVVAPLGLIQAALDDVRAASGVIINVTSDAGVEGYPGWGGYGSSKAALEQISNVLSAEEPSIHVYWVDPGDMRTAMHQQAFPGEDISNRPDPQSVVPGFMRLIDLLPPSGRYRANDLLADGVRSDGAHVTETAP
jgi:NAD(P)-dependent dehydrogenase (short-subunit alcohol dehydrogenase family)